MAEQAYTLFTRENISMTVKVSPIPTDNLPKDLKPACATFVRDINDAVVTAKITPQELRAIFGILEEWCTAQAKFLSEAAKGAGSGN